MVWKTRFKPSASHENHKVVAKMKEMPVEDFYAPGAKVREDGRLMNDMLLVEVKKPAESKAPWDYYRVKATIPADQAFRPLKDGECSLVK